MSFVVSIATPPDVIETLKCEQSAKHVIRVHHRRWLGLRTRATLRRRVLPSIEHPVTKLMDMNTSSSGVFHKNKGGEKAAAQSLTHTKAV